VNGLNRIQIIGNLGADPEMKYIPSGSAMATFSVAVNRTYTNPDGEAAEETDWFNVVAWNKQAESCGKFLAKGQPVYVEGRLHTRSWDGQNGQKHYRTEIIANQVIFLGKKANEDRSEIGELEEIPF
jgi:single-strand DNA-binding protein